MQSLATRLRARILARLLVRAACTTEWGEDRATPASEVSASGSTIVLRTNGVWNNVCCLSRERVQHCVSFVQALASAPPLPHCS